MTDTTPTPADRPAEGLLGPITPIRCNVIGCHWLAHGVPDKYADSRARIIREHMAAEHAPTPEPADRPAVLLRDRLRTAAQRALESLDSLIADHQDPGAEALGARYELARELSNTSPEMARQLLGTTGGAGALDDEEEFGEPVCVDECGSCDVCGYEVFGTPAEGWREAARFLRRTPRDSADFSGALRGARLIEDELRRRAEAHDAAAPPAPADRAATSDEWSALLNQAADRMNPTWFTDEATAAAAKATMRCLAADAAAGVQPPTTADRAAALGMTPTEYRQHSHNTAVQQIQDAAQGLFAGTAIRVMDALKEPTTPPAAPAAPEETQ